MKIYQILTVIFMAGIATAQAETKFEFDAKLVGYSFNAGPFVSQKEAALPKLKINSGQQAQMENVVDYQYPVTFDQDGTPRNFETSGVGFQVPIMVFTKDGKTMYQGRANLCDVINARSGFPSILKTSTPFSGTLDPGKPILVEVPTPSGGKATLVMTINKL